MSETNHAASAVAMGLIGGEEATRLIEGKSALARLEDERMQLVSGLKRMKAELEHTMEVAIKARLLSEAEVKATYEQPLLDCVLLALEEGYRARRWVVGRGFTIDD